LDVRILILAIASAIAFQGADPVAERVQKKIDAIESDTSKPGAVIVFSAAELNTWARARIPGIVPKGFRQARLELGNGTATGYALIDFLQVRSGAGIETNWLVGKLIQGEKPVKVIARMESGNGHATVYLTRVEIGGLGVSGPTLDFFIHTFFLPIYPDAKIGQQFELKHRIDRIESTPAAVRVYIGGTGHSIPK
jgi:hypothetical protein